MRMAPDFPVLIIAGMAQCPPYKLREDLYGRVRLRWKVKDAPAIEKNETAMESTFPQCRID